MQMASVLLQWWMLAKVVSASDKESQNPPDHLWNENKIKMYENLKNRANTKIKMTNGINAC